jgi:hypothetical protein
MLNQTTKQLIDSFEKEKGKPVEEKREECRVTMKELYLNSLSFDTNHDLRHYLMKVELVCQLKNKELKIDLWRLL